jgi:hypothetical protein
MSSETLVNRRWITLAAVFLLVALFTASVTERSSAQGGAIGNDMWGWKDAPMGITPSQSLRVCVGRTATTANPTGHVTMTNEWIQSDGAVLLTQQLTLARAGFQCVDTTTEELRLAGFTPETTGRVQFTLPITSSRPAPTDRVSVPDTLIFLGPGVYGAVEIVDLTTGETSIHWRPLLQFSTTDENTGTQPSAAAPAPIGITTSQILRVCPSGPAGQSGRTGAAAVQVEVLNTAGAVVLSQPPVPSAGGFACTDFTPSELIAAGLAAESSGRLQFAIRLAPLATGAVGGSASIEVIDTSTGETKVHFELLEDRVGDAG